MNEANEAKEDNDGIPPAPEPMVMNLPSSLGAIDGDDISLPLSLIKGLRRKGLDPSAATNAMDSSTSSNNTSDKDDSGGDEEGGSNTSSTSKVGQISSLSGSEQEGNNRGRVGILRVSGVNNNTGFSSSSDENITGDDELSEKVVVRGKSVTSSQEQEQQVQYKVSFAEGHCSKKNKTTGNKHGDEDAPSPKRKRSQDKNNSSSTSRHEEKKNGKRQRINDPSFQVSDSSGNEGRGTLANGHDQQHGLRDSNAPATAVSSSSSATSGQGYNSSPLYTEVTANQEQNKNDPMSSPKLTSTNDPSKFSIDKSPSSPSKEQMFHDSEERRRERNQREKERSNKIASQVDTLRCLLQRGGLFIPKKTKSSVLSEASNYIKTLQDRQQVMSMEMENLKCQLVTAVAARGQQMQMQAKSQEGEEGGAEDYRLIFKNIMTGMCVASMGGALLDCNAAFEKETGLSRLKLSKMTIFNMIHTNDLQRALDLISRMIDTGYVVDRNGNKGNQAPVDPPQDHQGQDQQEPLLLQSSLQNRPDLGLGVTLVRGADTLPKCFSVTLVKNVSSGIDGSNGCIVPFNPALPTMPSMPIDSIPTMKAMPQAGIVMTNNTALAPGSNSVPDPSMLQAVAPHATLSAPQHTALQTPQLLQLLLLQQHLQGREQQQIPIVQQQQAQPQLQQEVSQVPPQLQAGGMGQTPTLVPGPAISGQWNAQSIAMLPQLQQILKTPGSNSSSLGSDRTDIEGLIQNQPALLGQQVPGYLNTQNLPILPQIQQVLRPPESNASSKGNKGNSEDEKVDSRTWYLSG